jgi:hypothetical protein
MAATICGSSQPTGTTSIHRMDFRGYAVDRFGDAADGFQLAVVEVYEDPYGAVGCFTVGHRGEHVLGH